MPPFHHLNHFADDDDHDDLFIPLNEQHRTLSEASEMSAYTAPPDDEALRVHPYQTLQGKKVAVIGGGAHGILCASVLKKDGHQVTVLEESSSVGGFDHVHPENEHPDFPLDDEPFDYFEQCVDHFGLNVKLCTHVEQMKEKFGGWVVTTSTSSPPLHKQQNNDEYFDFVVIATHTRQDTVPKSVDNIGPPTRFRYQYLLPCLQRLEMLAVAFLGLISYLLKQLRLGSAIMETFSRCSDHSMQKPSARSTTFYHFLPLQHQEKLSEDLTPLYRRLISPDVPNVAFVGQERSCTASRTYLSSIWLSTFLYGEMSVPSKNEQREMIQRKLCNDKGTREEMSGTNIFHYNDMIMQDLGLDRNRKGGLFGELFGRYTPADYRGLLGQIQYRRQIAQQEGWAVPLTPVGDDL
mmetsp:Transcript_15048/g.28194  ORF Transcript_15048/g.28194 Transcript_15048/m.28194 type:complete len:407 (+) Transcript_15048:88-1308(+)